MSDISDHVEAEEVPLNKLFSENNTYQIPNFQRPFSWDEDNFEELVDDIVSALQQEVDDWTLDEGVKRSQDDDMPINPGDCEPYFLGSLILIESPDDGEAKFSVIDGQQRLTSLSILIGVIRDMINNEWSNIVGEGWDDTLQKYIKVEADIIKGTEEMVRMHLRESHEDFYEENVLNPSATTDVPEDTSQLPEPQQRIVTAVNTFRDYLHRWVKEDHGDPTKLIPYLTLRVALVKIDSYSLQSAFRLFNVTNDRGTPLTNADLLKSINLKEIPENKRQEYSDTWERMEEEVSNEGMERLIGLMRHIIRKDKNRSTVQDEFKNKIFENNTGLKGQGFVDMLESVYNIYRKRIEKKEINTEEERKNNHYHNLSSLMFDVYPSTEWMLPIILFDRKFDSDEKLYEMFVKIEKLLAVGWFTTESTGDRYNMMYELLEDIEEADSPSEAISSSILSSVTEQDAIELWNALEVTNFYRKGNYNWPKYLFLRMEINNTDNSVKKVEYTENISIEHIYPRNPEDSHWEGFFDNSEDENLWKNRLGNLVPLAKSKNYKASNYKFEKKVKKYFQSGESDLKLVNDLQKHDDWKYGVMRNRHYNLKTEAVEVWFEEVPEEAKST